jgi:hypothetical protein
MAEHPAEPSPPSQTSRQINRGNQPGRKSVYSQAVELQDTIMNASRNPGTTPSALAQLARAWSELEERKRILRMKPKPKDIDVSPEANRRRMGELKAANVAMIADAPTMTKAGPEPHTDTGNGNGAPTALDLPDEATDDDQKV